MAISHAVGLDTVREEVAASLVPQQATLSSTLHIWPYLAVNSCICSVKYAKCVLDT